MRVTIVAALKPWNAEHAGGRITLPLRANGIPCRGINILMLWGEAMAKGYTAPIWMTFKQALELNACVRKGEISGSTPAQKGSSIASSRCNPSRFGVSFMAQAQMTHRWISLPWLRGSKRLRRRRP
jgi:hypothetical protein